MVTAGGRRVEIGLGSDKAVSLSTARALATAMREAAATGRNPRDVLIAAKPAEAQRVPTFGDFAEEYITSVEAGWKNPTHRQQWRNSLRDHAAALAAVPIDAVDTAMVLDVLRPIWLAKSETASRVRGRIEKILDAAKVRDLRSRDALNPAFAQRSSHPCCSPSRAAWRGGTTRRCRTPRCQASCGICGRARPWQPDAWSLPS